MKNYHACSWRQLNIPYDPVHPMKALLSYGPEPRPGACSAPYTDPCPQGYVPGYMPGSAMASCIRDRADLNISARCDRATDGSIGPSAVRYGR